MTHHLHVLVGEHYRHVVRFYDHYCVCFDTPNDTPVLTDTPADVYQKKLFVPFAPLLSGCSINATLKAGTASSLCRDCITFKMCAV